MCFKNQQSKTRGGATCFPHMWLRFLDHTPICHIPFWGLRGQGPGELPISGVGAQHQRLLVVSLAWIPKAQPGCPVLPQFLGPSAVGKESCPGVTHPVGGMGQCVNASSKALEWWVWRPMRKKSSESLQRSKLAGLPLGGWPPGGGVRRMGRAG